MSDWRVPGFTSTGSKRPDALFGGAGAAPGEDAGLPERMLRAMAIEVVKYGERLARSGIHVDR